MGSKPSKAASLQSAGLLVLLCWAALLLALTFVPHFAALLHPVGRAIEHLGQFGDAFAPVTAFFAMYAAAFAKRSYDAQHQQLEDERLRNRQEHDRAAEELRRSRQQRLESLFFQLVEYWKQETPEPILAAMEPFLGPLKYAQSAASETGIDAPFSILWREQLSSDWRFVAIDRLVKATLRWLSTESRGLDTEGIAGLLLARLTEDQRFFWQLATADTGDRDLIDFADSMGLFGEPGISVEDARVFERAA